MENGNKQEQNKKKERKKVSKKERKEERTKERKKEISKPSIENRNKTLKKKKGVGNSRYNLYKQVLTLCSQAEAGESPDRFSAVSEISQF